MKKCMKKVLYVILLSSVGGVVNAATISAGSWTTAAKVISVGSYNGTFRIETDTTDNTSAVCASANGAYWWWGTDASSKEIYSMALAAYTAGKKIKVSYTDECNNSAKKINYIVILDN